MEYMQDLVALNRKKRTGGGQALCNLWSRYAPSLHSGSGRLSEWGNGGFRKGAIKAGMNGHIAKLTDEAVIRKHLEQIF